MKWYEVSVVFVQRCIKSEEEVGLEGGRKEEEWVEVEQEEVDDDDEEEGEDERSVEDG